MEAETSQSHPFYQINTPPERRKTPTRLQSCDDTGKRPIELENNEAKDGDGDEEQVGEGGKGRGQAENGEGFEGKDEKGGEEEGEGGEGEQSRGEGEEEASEGDREGSEGRQELDRAAIEAAVDAAGDGGGGGKEEQQGRGGVKGDDAGG